MKLNSLDKLLKVNDCFCIAKLDGFLTAVISAPNFIDIARWSYISNVCFLSDDILEMVMCFYDKIYQQLRDNSYTPVFSTTNKLNTPKKEASLWVVGYIIGKDLWDKDIVKHHEKDISHLLFPILSLSENYENISDEIIANLPGICINIYKFWFKKSCMDQTKLRYCSKQSKAKQSKAKQSKAKQSKAKQSKASALKRSFRKSDSSLMWEYN
jgi:yecA family protein